MGGGGGSVLGSCVVVINGSCALRRMELKLKQTELMRFMINKMNWKENKVEAVSSRAMSQYCAEVGTYEAALFVSNVPPGRLCV